MDSIKQMKRQAKRLAKAQHIAHTKALDIVATRAGFGNWSLLRKHHRKITAVGYTPVPVGTPTKTTSASPSPAPKKRWHNISRIAKEFAKTVPAMKKVFIAHGWMDPKGVPTAKAIRMGIVDIGTIESSYHPPGTIMPYYRWDRDFMNSVLTPPSDVELFSHVTSRNQADKQMTKAFVRAGNVLGLYTPDNAAAKKIGLHPETARTIWLAQAGYIEWNMGTYSYLFAMTSEEADRVGAKLAPVVLDLSQKLHAIDPYEEILFLEVTQRLHQWFVKQTV